MAQIAPSKNEVTWLVKSGERILGPYSAEAIEKLLLSREIVVIDEVKKSLGRWKYIREEAYFAVIVERMRVQNQSKIDDTEHGTLSNPTATLTGTPTVTATLTGELSKTIDLEVPVKESAQSSFIKEAEFVDIEVPKSNMPPISALTKQYGMTATPEIQQNIKKSSSAAWIFATIFVIIAVIISYKNQSKTNQSASGPDFARSFDLAVKNYKQGFFADSLKYYKEASAIKPNDPDVVIGMAPLLLSIEGQKVEVKRKIGEILAIVHSEDQVKQAKNILGLVAIVDEDFTEASKQFSDALKIDPKYLPALFNMGIVHFLQKDFSASILDFSNVLIEDPENATAAYLIIRTKVVLAVLLKKSSVQDIHELISQFEKRFYDLRQEAILLNAYLYSREDMKVQFQENIRACLESDPFVTDEFLRGPLFSNSQLGWIHLTTYCEEMAKKFPNSSDMKALNALCHVKTGRAQEGPRLIEEALAQAPSDSLLLDVKAFILMTSGRVDEAHGALAIAKKNQNDILSKILMGRICMKNKQDLCVRENFQHLGKQDFTPAIAAVGLAEVSRREGSIGTAKLYRDQLKRNLQNYLPSLRLEYELGEK